MEKNVNVLSGFYISLIDIKIEPFWAAFLQANINADKTYPPILRLNLISEELPVKIGALERVRVYSDDFVEYLLNDKKKDIKQEKRGIIKWN